MARIARFISWVFHPLFMPIATLGLAMLIDPKLSYFLNAGILLRFFSFLAIMTIAFPAVSILLLRYQGVISSVHMPDRQERTTPFAMVLVYYVITYGFLMRIPLDPVVYCMQMGAILALVLTILINLSWKISVHMVGIGGLVGCIVALVTYHRPMDATHLIGGLMLIAGTVGTARLLLHAHEPKEIYGGFFLGLSCVFITVAIGAPILF